MPLAKKGKADAFAAIKAEAEENGITLTKTDSGEFMATYDAEDGEIEWGPGPDARAVLDDMLAMAAMEEEKDTYTYDEDGAGGARVTVAGIRGHFDADTFAAAFAAASEAVQKAKAEADKPKAKAGRKAKIEAEENEAETAVSRRIADKIEPEVLPPLKQAPNGGERSPERILGDSDTLRRLGEGFNKLSEVLKGLADAMHRDEALVPFMGAEFSEDDPPAATSRVKRERIARDRGR